MGIQEWILSIIGVTVLSLIVDVVLPEGETAKYIKSVFALLSVLVIALPLPKVFRSQEYESVFSYSYTQLDEGFLNYLGDAKANNSEYLLLSVINNDGEICQKVQVVSGYVEDIYKVDYIEIYLLNEVIKSQYSHIDISEKVSSAITQIFGDSSIVYSIHYV